MSEGGGGKKKAAGPPFRRGKWTTEEENYALRLITEFKGGLLPLQDGTTLRTFLSKLLNCDPMRISKKFVGGNCIGKQVFKRRQQDIDRLTPEDLERTRLEISDLEKRFLEKTAQLNRAQQDPAALLSGGGPKLGRLGGVLSPEDCILPPWMMPPSQQDAAQGGAKPPQSLKTSSRLSNRAAMLNDASHFGTFGDAHVAFEDVPQTFSDWTYYSAAAGAEGEDEGGVDLNSAPPHNQGDVYFGNHDQETINSKKKTRNNKDERDERNLSTGLLSYNSLDGSSSSSSSAAALNSSYLGRISLTDMSSSTSLYSGVDSSNSSSSNSGGSSSSSSAGSVVGEDDDAVTDTSSISMRVRSVPATHSVVGRPPADSIVSNSSAVTTASNTTAPGDPGGGGGNMNKGLIRNSSVDNFWFLVNSGDIPIPDQDTLTQSFVSSDPASASAKAIAAEVAASAMSVAATAAAAAAAVSSGSGGLEDPATLSLSDAERESEMVRNHYFQYQQQQLLHQYQSAVQMQSNDAINMMYDTTSLGKRKAEEE